MANPDLSAIATSFGKLGSAIFGKKVVQWDLRGEGIQVRTNVKTPQFMTKLSAVGHPQLYRSQDDTSGNGVKYTDRTLTAHQTKWDSDFDPEQFRNTYLADPAAAEGNFVQAANNQMAKEYLAQLLTSVLGSGVYSAGGTNLADIADGWLTIIANEITATNLTPVATGAITNTNALDSVEAVAQSVPEWMLQMGFRVYCSYQTFFKYTKNYRNANGFGFNPTPTGEYKLDNLNAILDPQVWMGTSQRIIACVDQNLVFGTDIEQVAFFPSVRRNIIENRAMMPVGCQIQDLDGIYVNDAA
jgi:hypothetical protein